MSGTQSDPHTAADRDFHDATAHLYDSTLAPVFGAYQDLVVARYLDDLAARTPGGKAADIGCGTGVLTVAMAKRGLAVHGIDHSRGMLDIARAKVAAEVPRAEVEFTEGDIRTLPFGEGELDAIGCQGVLHHLEDIPALINEFARVLAPGGVVYLAEPCLSSNLGLRIWRRAAHAIAKPDPAPEAAGEGELAIPDHEEGPIDPNALLDALARDAFECRVEYWSEYAGLQRLPQPIYKAALRGLTKPWRRRGGNMMFVLATKSSEAQA